MVVEDSIHQHLGRNELGFSLLGKSSKWSLLPLREILWKNLLHKHSKSMHSIADKSWEIAPSSITITRPAYYLPNQLARVTGWEFISEHPRRLMEGNFEDFQSPTRAFLIKDAFLIDGVLYKKDACLHLNPRITHPFLQLSIENEVARGAVYCTFPGNRYFGNWLMDDCLAYPLAVKEGTPITTNQLTFPHVLPYEKVLGMQPTRLQSAYFKELVIFDDLGNNLDRAQRSFALREKLLSAVEAKPFPGVFILRGATGEKRILNNELEIAEHLRDTRGFQIVDPAKEDVSNIIASCAGAQVVIGVEGSHLIHGVQLLATGGALLTLQPPNRFVPAYKAGTDRGQQQFGFVVGTAEKNGFSIDITEVERTLDLFHLI